MISLLFFFNDTATTEIYTLSLHDALPILNRRRDARGCRNCVALPGIGVEDRVANIFICGAMKFLRTALGGNAKDRKSTRLNSSHGYISYAVFCLKKKRR